MRESENIESLAVADTAARQAPAGGAAPNAGGIRVLPMSLVNKIAAGEVVERPASVVKELLENAMDAGATQISIAIEQGGRGLIRITDDGAGIPAEEVPLAFAQHATSKIRSVEDLFAIATMGFRGEALASIAAVSHCSMVTRRRDANEAVRFVPNALDKARGEPCAAPPGTTIEVRDLFYSVPARRKFLRGDQTEFGHIHDMVLRTALPAANVAITLTHNGRAALSLAATTDHRRRVSQALGDELYDQWIPLNYSDAAMSVTGFAGTPELARPATRLQYVFLNGRFIRDRSIVHAIREAYRGLVEPGSQPAAILFLTMDPLGFDVNVHPQKIEVRFRDSNAPHRAVLAAIREQLLQTDLTPGMKVPAFTATAAEDERRAIESRQRVADFFKEATPSQSGLAFGVEAAARRERAAGIPGGGAGGPAAPNGLEAMRSAARAFSLQPRPPADAAVSDQAWDLDAKSPAPVVQLHNTYLVAETPDGLVIVDQHALHERIIYEELFARVTAGTLECQRLLLPEVLPITPGQAAALESVKPLLATLGMEVAEFDQQSVAIHTFPSLLSKLSPREFLRDLLETLHEARDRLSPERLLHEVLDMASCKAAIKAGYTLSPDEIRSLLARKEDVDRSSNCPHGRPTTLRLTLHDLEKQFKRK